MKSSMSASDGEARILDYWRRRPSLSEAEWTDFYRLAVPVLMATRLPAEYADRSARRDLVNLFFTEKIFLNAATSQAGPLESVHALHGYLKRFAIDLQRRKGPEEDELPEEATCGLDDGAAEASASYARILAEAGIDPEQAGRSAEVFLKELDEGEAAYLRHHSCADEDDKEPISGIAQRLALGTSYHYKAKSLGITRSKGETYIGYEKTKIGRWLVSLGAKLSEEWREELAVLLVLLCLKVHELPEVRP